MSENGGPIPGADDEKLPPKTFRPKRGRRRPGMLRTMARLSLGAGLLVVDTLIDRLEEDEIEPLPSSAERRPVEAVLIPADEWDTVLEDVEIRPAGYALLGLLSAYGARVRQGRTAWQRAARLGGMTVDFMLEPLRSSWLFAPLRDRYETLVEHGQAEVRHWTDAGRVEQDRSRALAQTAINQFIENTMEELIDSPRFELLVQEMVEVQGRGMMDEVVEEIRERTVTLDTLSERFVRARLGRPPRESLPPPTAIAGRLAKPHTPELPITQPSLQGHYAGFAGRLLAFAADVVALVTALTVASWFVATVNALFGIENFLAAFLGAGDLTQAKALVASLVVAGFVIGYPLFFWIFTGQTPGKMLLGLRVVTLEGGRLSLGRAVRRLIGYVLAALPLYLGFVWILADDRRQGWHDKVAGTCVVYAWPARPDENFLKEELLAGQPPPPKPDSIQLEPGVDR
ncbi:MAG: RDD family protein [Anaerolineae bacterium]|jgi:uncharacterized RDD family membrane protein YckC